MMKAAHTVYSTNVRALQHGARGSSGASIGGKAAAAMQLQGYAERIGRSQKWRTTEEGRTVSGAKAPRFTREVVEQGFPL